MWTIEYYDSSWQTWGGAIVDRIPQEKNGQEEAIIQVPNTSTNRSRVSSDLDVRIKYDGNVIFTGVLTGVQYRQDFLTCYVLIECTEWMRRKVITGTHMSTAVSTVLSEICTAASVTYGSCPTGGVVSVRFDRALCYDAAKFLADIENKDIWGVSKVCHIGDRGTDHGSITVVGISSRGIDRGLSRNHCIIRGTDEEGVALYGEAYYDGSYHQGSPGVGFGKKTYVYTEKKASDQATLDNLAESKLREITSESAGSKVNMDITHGYNILPCDMVGLHNEMLNLDDSYEVIKVTKTQSHVTLEVDKLVDDTEQRFEDLKSYEDLGIYVMSHSQLSPVMISSQGLELLLHLDEGSGTVARDASANLNDGTLINTPTWSEGKFGQCLDFVEASSQYVQVQNHSSLQIEDNITLSVWINQDNTRGFYIRKGGSTLGGYILGRTSGGRIYFYIATTGSGVGMWADEEYDPGPGWHHVVGVCKKKDDTTSTMKIYIDGVLVKSSDETIVLDCDHTGVMEIFGDDWYGSAEYYDGRGDEVRIYSRALTDIEVSALYLYGSISETPPIPNVDSIHDVDLGPPTGFDATDINALSEVDPDGTVRAWFRVTISRVTGAVGYLLAYREDTESNWSYLEVEQKASGNAVVVTPHIRPSPAGSGRTYVFKACTISKLNQLSSWTSEVNKDAAKDTSAPGTPSGATATSLSNSVLIEWTKNTEGDLSHYEVYLNTVNDSGTATKIADCKTNYFFWHIESSSDYVTQYFWVKAVDRSGNVSGFSTVVSATPGTLAPVDLGIELRPWTSNIKFWFNEGSPDDIYWSAPEDETTDPTIEFADGTSVGINADSVTSLALGLHYFYFDESYKTGDKYDVQHSVNYNDAVGEGKGLLAAIQVGKYAMEIRLGCGETVTIINTYYKLMTEFEGDEYSAADTIAGDYSVKLGIRVWKYHSNDTLTEITAGSPVAQVDATDTEQTVTGTWSCPESSLASTDRILVRVYNLFTGVGWYELAAFITEQLGATKLVGNQWSVNYRQRRNYAGGTTYIYLYWGSETRKTSIEKFKYIGSDDTSTILPFNSYAPSIGAGVIVTDSILSNHIRTDQIITRHLLAECITTEKIKALAIDTGKLAADAVTAAKIAASAITTEHLNLDLLTSDPSYVAGRIWYRTDFDQLRFSAGTQLSDVSVIPKEPLYEMQSKQENLITNADFEVDRNGDDIPDFWTRGGSGTYADAKRVTTDSVRGGACVELQANGGTNWCRIMSQFIQVVPGKEYYLKTMVKGGVQNNNDLLVQVRQYKRDKTASTTAYKNYFTNEDAWPSGESQAWYEKNGTYEADSDAYYVKIFCYCYNPTSNGKVWYDDIIFSEIRAAEPAAETVGGYVTHYNSSVTIGTIDTEIEDISSDLDFDCDVLFVGLQITDPDEAARFIEFWFEDSTDSVDSNITTIETHLSRSQFALLTLPRNVNGHTVKVYAKVSGATSIDVDHIAVYVWGHSPHKHR